MVAIMDRSVFSFLMLYTSTSFPTQHFNKYNDSKEGL